MKRGEKQIGRHKKEAGKNTSLRVERGKEKLLITRMQGNKLGGLQRLRLKMKLRRKRKHGNQPTKIIQGEKIRKKDIEKDEKYMGGF